MFIKLFLFATLCYFVSAYDVNYESLYDAKDAAVTHERTRRNSPTAPYGYKSKYTPQVYSSEEYDDNPHLLRPLKSQRYGRNSPTAPHGYKSKYTPQVYSSEEYDNNPYLLRPLKGQRYGGGRSSAKKASKQKDISTYGGSGWGGHGKK